MRHNNMASISAITYNQRPSMEPATVADANNNHNGLGSYGTHPLAADGAGTLASEIRKDEKYSLRQRQSRRTTQPPEPASVSRNNPKEPKEKATPKEKPKPKAAPLSKYRRKTANARERSRMREINSAFENLRRAVPVAVAGSSGTSSPVSPPAHCAGSAASSEKLTKITTLRLAMKYIRILSDMLHGTTSTTLENNNDLDVINHNEIEREVMQKGLLLREGALSMAAGYLSSPVDSPVESCGRTQPGTSSSSTSNPRKRASTSKRSTSSSSRAKKPTTNANNAPSQGRSRSTRKSATSKTAPPVTPMEKIDDNLSLALVDPTRSDPLGMDVDLGSVLESDNDSLILSEPCLSPLTGGAGVGGLKSHAFACTDRQPVMPNDGLEFGLFLESDADSLQLSEPCLSPLSHLDSLNPFNDLLHTGFNEQTALELYL
ncbi:helix-loop-helix protein delilah [Anopheles nili]|uniref:helix-loop-helix protein delilah n=1 Tax=Anopheles nili TaxID=185578 RepID=UPI00237C4A38|nr:helix-loop-helix protein delilah [Anopheles nili]